MTYKNNEINDIGTCINSIIEEDISINWRDIMHDNDSISVPKLKLLITQKFLNKTLSEIQNNEIIKSLNYLKLSPQELLNLYFDSLNNGIIRSVGLYKTDIPFNN